MHPAELVVRTPGTLDYPLVWRAMRDFTAARDAATPDELWLLQHPPVFTQGQAGRAEHIIADPGEIPVIQTDRGGQVTYHGPGQLIVYLLLDLRRREFGVRGLVCTLEDSVVRLLARHAVTAQARSDARGVYVDGRKIAALGLRVRHGCTYHGLSLNVRMDLTPFRLINPCGYSGLQLTQTSDLGIEAAPGELGRELLDELCRQLGYNSVRHARQLPLSATQNAPA